jgi:spermidine synthase
MDRKDLTRGLMFLLFFLSGISGLVYQIVWTRQLVLVFGNTLLATSTVLTAFMAGLAAGSYLLGRYIDAGPRQLIRLYALLEAGIGGFALLFPLLLAAATPLYTGLYRVLEGNIALLNLVRFGVCSGLILIPTFLMGGTLPVLIKRFVEKDRSIGHQTGFLYGLNTAGAMVGCLASGYFLLRTLGMQKTTWVAVGINLGVAAIAWVLARGEEVTDGDDELPAASEVKAGEERPRYSTTTIRLVLVGIGLSGFCALAYEVFWTRMLNLFLNNNIYSFTAVLATFLAGIALGSLIYSTFLSRVERPVVLFASIEIAIGLMAYATPFVFNLLHRTLFFRQSEALTLAKTAVIMIAPTVLMGIAVPLAVEICQRGPRREGTTVGTVYAVNTVGAILGAFAAGFVLIPTIGLHRGLIAVVGLNILAGVLPLISEARPARRPIWVGAFVGVVALLFLAAPATLFRGLYQKYQPTADILHYKEGKIANVVVYDFVKSGFKDLYLNAIEEASSRIWHVQLFKMLGILPVVVHPEPDNALMIAFGAGMSAGACVDEVEGLDCVDLNPDITGVAAVFTHENRDVINNPGLNMIVNDGRNALLLDPKQYSLIISDATNPKTFDSWTLYTREFYELVKARLKPGGVFGQWVVMPLPYDSMSILLNTFKSVSSQCIMLGTPERLEIDYQDFSNRLQPMLTRVGLPEYGVEDTDKFLSFMLLGEDELEQALAGFSKINTDDLPAAQFRIRGDAEGVRDFLGLLSHQTTILPYLTNLGGEEKRVKATLETYRSLARRLTLGFLLNNTGEYREAAAEAAVAGMGEDENVKSALKYDSERKRYFSRRVAETGGDANDHNNLGYIHWQEGDYERAIGELQRAVDSSPDFANALANLARVYTDAGLYDEATETWLKVRKINPTRKNLSTSTRQLDIIHLLRKLCYQPDSSALYASLGELLLADGETVRAARATRKAADLSQGDPQIYFRLARMYENLELVDQALETYGELAVLMPEDERFPRAVDNLEILRTDPAAKQRWLNSNEIVIEGEEAADEHPSTCREASQVWNDAPFEGKIGSESLERAAALYEKSIRAQPEDLHAYADAARIYELLGEFGRAASFWRRGLEVVPGNRAAENNVRRLELLAATGGPEELLEIGQLFRFNGETDTAIEFFSRAVETDPTVFDSQAHLAAGYDEIGRYHEAALAYERALDLQPDGAGARVIQERLQRLEDLLGNCKIYGRGERE